MGFTLRCLLAAVLAASAAPALADWGPPGQDDATYPAAARTAVFGGSSSDFGPGIEHDDATYGLGAVYREVPAVRLPRGPKPAWQDDTVYAGDLAPEESEAPAETPPSLVRAD